MFVPMFIDMSHLGFGRIRVNVSPRVCARYMGGSTGQKYQLEHGSVGSEHLALSFSHVAL